MGLWLSVVRGQCYIPQNRKINTIPNHWNEISIPSWGSRFETTTVLTSLKETPAEAEVISCRSFTVRLGVPCFTRREMKLVGRDWSCLRRTNSPETLSQRETYGNIITSKCLSILLYLNSFCKPLYKLRIGNWTVLWDAYKPTWHCLRGSFTYIHFQFQFCVFPLLGWIRSLAASRFNEHHWTHLHHYIGLLSRILAAAPGFVTCPRCTFSTPSVCSTGARWASSSKLKSGCVRFAIQKRINYIVNWMGL